MSNYSGRYRITAAILTILLAASATAQEPKRPAGVKLLKDVSYGPHDRNVMDLYLPEAEGKPRPVVLCIHGGGWAAGDKARYQYLAEALAQKGFAAAAVTYRFAPGTRSPGQMEDVQRAVRWLRKNASQYHLDSERFGAIGGSAGGHLASYVALAEPLDNSDAELSKFSCKVQCAVDCYGPVDLAAMMKSASAPIVEGFLGMPLAGHEDAYRKASPISHIKSTPPPFLIVHGTLDVGKERGQVPMEQSTEFHDKLKQAGGDVKLVKFEGAGHGFSHNATNKFAQETLTLATDFFTRHLMK
jgi:acetyl esterase/lipase